MKQPIFSKRIASCRPMPRNIRKLQVKVGQIVYYDDDPMMVSSISDCANWSKSFKIDGTKSNASGFMIYYHIVPLVKTMNGTWKRKPLYGRRRMSMMKASLQWKHMKGFIGHDVDMSEFTITHAESRWRQLRG